MSSTKLVDAADLRAGIARRRISHGDVAVAIGVSRKYVQMILAGRRDAPARRKQMIDDWV
ncbi:MAG: hypothetical protein GX133_03335 [Syntrophomonadaceae bacterium]|nr:hypothetical protein [Syntrophomonadaceae bacterium]